MVGGNKGVAGEVEDPMQWKVIFGNVCRDGVLVFIDLRRWDQKALYIMILYVRTFP